MKCRFLLCVVLFLVGCATPTSPIGTKFPTPQVGMSREQILGSYGQPYKRMMTGNGEVWSYWLNKGGSYNPFTLNYEPQTAIFLFDPTGTLIDFRYSQ